MGQLMALASFTGPPFELSNDSCAPGLVFRLPGYTGRGSGGRQEVPRLIALPEVTQPDMLSAIPIIHPSRILLVHPS